ncbi:pilus assembly protein [Pontibacillus yanchengensis]|uniref:Pilus assembly protein n=3 Tax=Pontibacillus yanchengensis TaxID=462910 RepID=A0ACC7VLK8_9BACI|nr:TadE/TadG family type IV pilus assembly protein [Pontibacillus yanchengensis]MYL33835.1 pilus assembly protein [Pontibacillus yanchengensis]MYL55707.1 pilus assembly protein [Pontibacillus yanchengensis]
MRNENGSISIEFLGILPFLFMFFLLLWQVVASGYAFMSAKSAVNDAAKTYSITEDVEKAQNTAQQALSGSTVIESVDITANSLGDGQFEVVLKARHPLIFVPDKWDELKNIPLTQRAIGRVLVDETS